MTSKLQGSKPPEFRASGRRHRKYVSCVGAVVLAAFVSACAPLEPMPPVVAYKTGLTLTIRNPFDCNEQTELICSDGNLDLECRCRPVGPTTDRTSLVHELQALVDAHDATDQ